MDPSRSAWSEHVHGVLDRARAALAVAERALAHAEERQRDAVERQRDLEVDVARRRSREPLGLVVRSLRAEPALRALLVGGARSRLVGEDRHDPSPAVAEDLAEERELHAAAQRRHGPPTTVSPAVRAALRDRLGEPTRRSSPR